MRILAHGTWGVQTFMTSATVAAAEAPPVTSSAGGTTPPSETLAGRPVIAGAGWRNVWVPVATTHAGLLGICITAAGLQSSLAAWLWWAVALTVSSATAAAATAAAPVLAAVLAAETVLVAASTHGQPADAPPFLPLLLAAVFAAGLRLGGRRAVLLAGLASATMLVTRATTPAGQPWPEFAAHALTWVALMVTVGVLPDWARRLHQPVAPDAAPQYGEALDLLSQLHGLARRLPGSLDAASVAEATLDGCHLLAPVDRSALLVDVGDGQLVPLAVRGTARVEWRHPIQAPGPLGRAWDQRRAVLDVRHADLTGRRRGSALLAVPLLADGRAMALLALETRDPDAFPPAVISRVVTYAEGNTLRLQTALAFEALRSAASVEERERLAREMHDGVAQDLVALGFALDALQRRAEPLDATLGADVGRLRSRVSGLVSDIRLSITDLRGSVTPTRGLGSALGAYLRSAGAGTGLAVHLSLRESGFRLPADSEVELLRIAKELIGAARRARATNLWVELNADPPSAELVVRHDAPTGVVADDVGVLEQRAARVGGRVTSARDGTEVRTVVTVLGGTAA